MTNPGTVKERAREVVITALRRYFDEGGWISNSHDRPAEAVVSALMAEGLLREEGISG